MPRDPHNRDDALSGYVRKRIRDWEASGRQLLELARIAGTSKATPSQVKRGLGVGGRSVDGFARAFGFGEDVEAFKRAAYEWWMAQGKAGAEAVDKPMTEAQVVAIEMLLGAQPGNEGPDGGDPRGLHGSTFRFQG